MGWFFEDFDPQATPVVTPEKTISETDVLAFAALDAEFVGSGGNWPVIARALWKSGVITPQAFDTACLLWAFGTLIGNTDMHSGNLSCLSEGRRPYELAPAYDMTPMAFAPTAGGGLPDRTLELTVGEQVSVPSTRSTPPLPQTMVSRVKPAVSKEKRR